MRLRFALIALAVTTTLGLPSVGVAVDTVTSCVQNCGNDCQLSGDLTCCSNLNLPQCKGGTGPITLASGSDLNFNGKKLICFCGTKTCNGGDQNNTICTVDSQCPGGVCTDSTGCSSCGTAVSMSASASVVKNTSPPVGGIYSGAAGPWTQGVDCNNKTSSRVTGVRIEATASASIDCWQTDQNVLVGNNSGIGINTTGVANTDSIHDNYIDNWYDSIWVWSSHDMSVDHNLIVARPGSRLGIFTAFSSTVDIENNFILGTGLGFACNEFACIDPVIIVPGSGNIEGNYCDPENPDCADCQAEGYCETPVAPFVFP